MKRLFLSLLIVLLLTGCGGKKTADLSPLEILMKTSEKMKTLQGFQVAIETSGAPAYLDLEGTLAISGMEGHYVAPDNVQATVRVIAPGLVVEVEVISIGEDIWQTNVFTGQWEEIPDNWGFNPSSLLEANAGFPAMLATDITELQLTKDVELEEMPGKKLYLISGEMKGDKLYDLTALIGPDPIDAQIWIDPDTFEVQRAILHESAGDPENERTWQIDFWDFNNTIEIEAPDIG